MKLRLFLAELKLYICNHIINKIPSHTIRLLFYRNVMNYTIGKHATIGLGCIFDMSGKLSVGEKSVISARCRLDSRGGLYISECVSISCDTIILTADHDPNNALEGRERPVFIKPNVFIGTRTMILPGVTIESHSVVAAGAVVAKNVPAATIVGGVPAKLVKEIPGGILVKEFQPYRRLFQ